MFFGVIPKPSHPGPGKDCEVFFFRYLFFEFFIFATLRMVAILVSFWGPAYFQGQAVSFREGNPTFLGVF